MSEPGGRTRRDYECNSMANAPQGLDANTNAAAPTSTNSNSSVANHQTSPQVALQAIMPPPPRPLVNGSPSGAVQVVVNGDSVPIGQIRPRRQPRNMQGLLQCSLDATNHDEDPNAEHPPMTDERRQFLEGAIREMTIDASKVVIEAIKVLSDGAIVSAVQAGDPLPLNIKLAFENLTEYVYDIDIARDFCRIGGFAVFAVCFDSPNDEIRAKAYNLLAEVCQNNPPCQTYAVDELFLEKLMKSVPEETEECLAKVLYALSSLIRTHEPACDYFYKNNGCNILTDVLLNNTNDEKVLLKVVHLVKILMAKDVRIKEKLVSLNIAAILLPLFGRDLSSCTEHAAEALLALAEEGHPAILETLSTPEAIRLIRCESHASCIALSDLLIGRNG